MSREFSRQVRLAAQLLGAQVREARIGRTWTIAELAARAQVSPTTVKKVERGDPTVGLGVAFDLATLVGVALFVDTQARLASELARREERLTLIATRVRPPANPVLDDDF